MAANNGPRAANRIRTSLSTIDENASIHSTDTSAGRESLSPSIDSVRLNRIKFDPSVGYKDIDVLPKEQTTRMKIGLQLNRIFYPSEDSVHSLKYRPKIVTFIKWYLVLNTLCGFIVSIIFISYGTGVVTDYISLYKDNQQSIDCLIKIWTVFMSMNIFFTLVELFGVITEQVCCIFMFSIYSFFVTFGAFFDMINENHLLLIYLVPMTLLSLIFMAIVRIERMDPLPAPQRKFSMVSAADKA